jgi:short-subunit dehydrogenase
MGGVKDKVVVITGASAGIGRSTALEFAERGASVVLVARRAEALDDLARECEDAGGRALAAPADVTDEEALRDVVRRSVERFGRIDVWVNNAAVSAFGRFEEVPSDVYRRVIETNLFGYVNGARAALAQFHEQGRGVLINVSSVVGVGAIPYTNAYSASKAAIRGFSDSLRQELLGENIDVCTILPASIDTPLFQQAANVFGRGAKPLNPANHPRVVARSIVGCAQRPRREVASGIGSGFSTFWARVTPRIYERVSARVVKRDHFLDEPSEPTEGNLFRPIAAPAQETGNWGGADPRRFLRRGRVLGGAAALAPLAGAGLALLWLRPRVTTTRRLQIGGAR